MLIFLAVLFLIFVISLSTLIFIEIQRNKSKSTRYADMSEMVATATTPIRQTKLNRILNKAARNRTKNYGKYKPGYLGVSAVSQAIKKDFGSILSRRQRKYYAKAYGIPFIAYRGF